LVHGNLKRIERHHQPGLLSLGDPGRFEYHEEHRRAIKETPLERLFLETDSPVVYGRGREFEYTSRPADIARTLPSVADLKGVSQAQIAAITTQNALNFFRL